MQACVIVLNWNGFEDTEKCIQSLLVQNYNDFKILLLDNNSSSSEQQKLITLAKANNSIELYLFDKNYGFCKAHTRIVDEQLLADKYEYITLLNNDAVADPDWLKNIIACAKETKADMVASKMVCMHDPGIIDNLGHYILSTGEILPFKSGEDANVDIQRQEVFGPCGGAALYSSQMIKKTGFYDPFFDTGYEDAEFGARASMVGYKCVLEPQALVHHKGSASIIKVKNHDYIVRMVVNTYYTCIKLMPWQNLIKIIPILIFKMLGISVIGILFFRPRIVTGHYLALWQISGIYRKELLAARRDFFNHWDPDWKIVAAVQKPFMKRYFGLLQRHVFSRNPTAFENY